MMLSDVPRTSFRLPFGIGVQDPLKGDLLDSDNLVVGRTSSRAPAAAFLGKLAEFEQMRRNVWLDCNGAHAVYVIGKRRSGKSYTLGALCEGLVSSSWLRLGHADQAVLLIDTLNIYGTFHVPSIESGAERPLWQLPSSGVQVKYLAPESSRGLISAPSTRLTVDPAWLTLEDWCSLFDIDPFADPMGHLMGAVFDVTKEKWRREEPAQADNSGIRDCIDVIASHPDALQFEDSTREALRRRLLALERLSFLARPSPRIVDLMNPGTITVCQVRDLDDRIRALIVAVFVRELMRERARADALGRYKDAQSALSQTTDSTSPDSTNLLPRCWIAIDEAHNYLPSSGSLPSKPILRRLITEGRNIGLSVVVATQQPSGLDGSIQRNADVLMVHSMSMRDDIAAAESMLNTQVPDSVTWGASEKASGKVFEKIVRALPQGYCLVSSDTASRVFGVRIRPRMSMHGGEGY